MPDELKVAYLLRSWPRLSQTFVLNEILEVERTGVPLAIFALARASDAVAQPQVADVAAPLTYLDGRARSAVRAHLTFARRSPGRYLSTLACALARRQLYGGYTKSSPGRAFDTAVRFAGQLQAGGPQGRFTHIHAHFAHDPALIGLLAHRLTGIPFSFTAHARDLYQIPDAALAARAAEATAVVTCCRTNVDHITARIGSATPVELIYHGVDLRRFHPAPTHPENVKPLILSIGRLVEKKGFDDLLRACALLTGSGCAFTCEIYGDGPCRAELEALRDQLELREVVTFGGARTQAELVPIYQRADVFALTPRVMEDGDRDGVPNVLFEAMACGLPVVTTTVGGIAELVHDGSNGLLADGDGVQGIASCLRQLLDDVSCRRRLGDGAARTAQGFDGRTAALRLAALYRHSDAAAS